MKLRVFLMAGLLMAGGIFASLFFHTASKEQSALEKTRRTLHDQGFKVRLDEFNFSAPAELRERARALTKSFDGYTRLQPFEAVASLPKAPVVGSNSTVVVWKRGEIESTEDIERWDARRKTRAATDPLMIPATAALFSGPFRFDLDANDGTGILLPHLYFLTRISRMASERTMDDLHDGRFDAAWTNLLVCTRVVTGWEVEPVEMSILVRYSCFDIAYDAVWQTLQTGWTEERLAAIQREFETAGFLRDLPETAAFDRAGYAGLCEIERQSPPRFAFPLDSMLRDPRKAWSYLNSYWRQVQYRRHGIFDEENQILLFYRDREVALRTAMPLTDWAAMRQVPGITNAPVIKTRGKTSSRITALMTMRQFQSAYSDRPQLASRAAVAEAKRRLLVTAIAVERFHARNGSYPDALSALAPEFLAHPPVDFMDGKPLRYQRTDDGHFVLYSVGLDCVDNGGTMIALNDKSPPPLESPARVGFSRSRFGRLADGTDLLWPRPASDTEIAAWEEQQQKKREARELARQALENASGSEVELLNQNP